MSFSSKEGAISFEEIDGMLKAGVPERNVLKGFPLKEVMQFKKWQATQKKRNNRKENTAATVPAPPQKKKVTLRRSVLEKVKSAWLSVKETMTPDVFLSKYQDDEEKVAAQVVTGKRVVKNVPSSIISAPSLPPASHPGWEYVATKGDGNCMFHSVYFAWHPEQGTAKANETPSAVSIRKIVSDFVQLKDLYGGEIIPGVTDLEDIQFTAQSLAQSIQMASGDEKKRLIDYARRLQQIFTGNKSREEKEAEILAIYKLVVLERTFWGDNRELQILNRYGRENGLPPINVWNAGIHQYIQPSPGGRPIHFNGVNHYSMLKPIETAEAAAIRNAENAVLRERNAEFQASEQHRLRVERLAAKRPQITKVAMNAFVERKGSEAIGKKLRDAIGEQYNNSTEDTTANFAYAKTIELGGSEEQAQAVRQSVSDKIASLRGGRRTRKQKKSSKRKTRKH